MKGFYLFLLVSSSLIFSSDAWSQLFRLKVEDYDGASESFVDQELKKIQDSINDDLTKEDPKSLLKNYADSAIVAGKGVGSDYTSDMKVFLVGAGLGGATESSEENVKGMGVAPGVVFGKTLSFMDATHLLGMETNKLSVFVNFMTLDRKFEYGSDSTAKLETTNMGIHLRYDWIQGQETSKFGFKWKGVKFLTGYEYNKSSFSFETSVNENVNASSGGNTLTGTIKASPKGEIAITTHSVPFELYTDVNFSDLIDLFVGAAADLNLGEAKGSGNKSSATLTGCGGACDVKVSAESNLNTTQKVDMANLRSFLGLQFNFGQLKIMTKVDKPIGNEIVGFTAAVRVVY